MAEGGKKLSEEEICEALKSLNVPFKKNELVSPTREFMVRVFECFVKDLQIDITSPDFRPWDATCHIEDGDIYDESVTLVLLAMIVNHIMYPMRLDITIKDIIDPKPKRTKKILNFIVVFWNYYIQKYVRFHKIQEALECEVRKAEELIRENESLEEKCNEMSEMLKNRQPNKEELLNAVAAKKEKLLKILQQKEDIGKEYASLKTKTANVATQISSTEVSIVTTKERLEELSQLILSSPDRLNTEIQRLRDRIKSEEMKIKEKEGKIKDTEKKLQQQENFLKDDEKALILLNQITEEVNNLRDSVKTIIDDKQKLEEEEDKLKKLQINLQQKEDKEAHHKQKSLKVAINTKKQTETFMAMLETYKNDEAKEKNNMESLKNVMNELQEHVETEKSAIKEIYEKSKEADTKTKERIAQHSSKMAEIVKKFKHDCESLELGIRKKFPDSYM